MLESKNLECEAIIKVSNRRNKQSNKQIKQLKELMKECQYMILAYSINHDTFTKEKVSDIITKIDEVLND